MTPFSRDVIRIRCGIAFVCLFLASWPCRQHERQPFPLAWHSVGSPSTQAR